VGAAGNGTGFRRLAVTAVVLDEEHEEDEAAACPKAAGAKIVASNTGNSNGNTNSLPAHEYDAVAGSPLSLLLASGLCCAAVAVSTRDSEFNAKINITHCIKRCDPSTTEHTINDPRHRMFRRKKPLDRMAKRTNASTSLSPPFQVTMYRGLHTKPQDNNTLAITSKPTTLVSRAINQPIPN
jgi:hypothetical protein